MNNKIISIPYEQSHSFSKLVLDFLAQKESLKKYAGATANFENILAQCNQKKSIDRNVLVEVLKQNYKNCGIENFDKQIEKLRDPNCFTICSAHQPNIFSGYLYVIYKIVHSIHLAQYLNEVQNGKQFIPVFYIGSEDHDIDEIGSIFLNDKKFRWQNQEGGACGRMKIDSLQEIKESLLAAFGNSQCELELKKNIALAYTPDRTLSEATQIFLHYLFSSHNLIILDADNALLKEKCNSLFEKELQFGFSEKIVNENIYALKKDYNINLHSQAINLFYLQKNQREKINSYDWKIANQFSLEKKELSIGDISPNVILRPLYQESILPNVVFIGGGGEVAYWLQLKSLFEQASITYPIVILRQSWALVSNKVFDKIKRFNEINFFDTKENLLKEIAKQNASYLIFEKELEHLNMEYEKLFADNNLPYLTQSMEAHRKKIARIHKQITEKYLRALKREDILSQERIDLVQAELFPNAKMQERYWNLLQSTLNFKIDVVQKLLDTKLTGLENAFMILNAEA